MYLKEIKATGFKSFADKININLDNKITCIVGPNGSGKSNIVDAVKWVMGEQSVKTLRGSNSMTDVIFQGSDSRHAQNIAMVTLIFDNSDSYLKVPYEEISVSRKVYKSGENEYFINNEQCRLKDIQDLFLDSGIGKYAFNIISQGEVSKIISDSPQERRSIIEEAAGVLKYKKRKEEALKKLDKTNENLVRVKDIITELETQLEPLEEQSIKAKEYLKISGSLEQIEIALLAHDITNLNNELTSIETKKEELETNVTKIATETSKNDLNKETKKEELEKLNNEINNLNNELLRLSKEEEKLNGEKNIIKERSKYDANDTKVHDNIASLKEQQLQINNRLISLKTDIDILTNKTNEIKEKINSKKVEITKEEEEKNNLNKRIYEHQKKITDLDYKIKSLEAYIEQGGSTPTSVKRILTNPRIKGIHNTISKLIETEDKYTIALEVALGGAKDYIVVNDPNNAKEAINYLKENKLGRATFYPLSVIKPRFIDEDTKQILREELGYINTLSNLVKCDEIYKNIIMNQLGNVIVTDTIDNANIISKKINNRYKIVTLSGEIINVGGSITGGNLNNRSVITEKHELENLKNTREKLKEELKVLEETNITSNNQEELINLEKEKALNDELISNKHETYIITKQEHERITLELNNLTDLSNDKLQAEEDKIITKYYETVQEKENTNKELNEKIKSKEELETYIDSLEANYRLSNNELREYETNLKDIEIRKAKISVKMDNMLEILSNNYQITYEKAKEKYILEIDENIARRNVNGLKNQIKRLGTINIAAIDEYERIKTRFDFLTNQSNDLEEASTTLLKIIDDLDGVMKQEFIKTFKNVEIEFNKVFRELFGGGKATLELTDKQDILNTGVDIVVTPPGKKLSTITLLSGGEKTLTAISLLFAILNIKNIPFCIFDEVEAALDEANVDKVGSYFKKYIGKTQLIIITHKKKTMEYADTLYGITMQESGVSKLVSVKLVDQKKE